MSVKFIADVGSNHNGSICRAFNLIQAAKTIGCDAVKFQFFRADRLFAAEFPSRQEAVKSSELPVEWLSRLRICCKEIGIEFHCTPFDVEGVDIIAPYVDEFKIASYSILDLRLIEKAASRLKPITISAGACTEDELKEAFLRARLINSRTKLMHCVANYPAAPSTCNLQAIHKMRDKYGDIGWSDHTVNPGVIHYAVAFGARVIEFHLDLEDMRGEESRYGHCWTTQFAKRMITSIRRSIDALGPQSESQIDLRWRNDPDDEARPVKKYRQELKEGKL